MYNDYDYLAHYGTLGMKWGIRKYQNPDGSLTEAGRARYGKKVDKYRAKLEKRLTKQLNKAKAQKNSALEASVNKKLRNARAMTDSDILYEKKQKATARRLVGGITAISTMLKKTPDIMRQAKRIESDNASMYIDDIPVKDKKTGRAKALSIAAMYTVAGAEGYAVGGTLGSIIGGAYMDSARNKHFNSKLDKKKK
jgi:hypothetical protein